MADARDTGGPAFPVLESSIAAAWVGMELRDYFAAHAPAEPAHWFVPTGDHENPPEPKVPENRTPEEQDEYKFVQEFWNVVKPEQLNTPRVRDWLMKRLEWRKAERLIAARRAKDRYTQWPYAWADAMLAERSKP